MKFIRKLFFPLLLLGAHCLLIDVGPAQTFDAIKGQVKEHTLSNGMKFIVLERPDAPVVSFHTYADVGSANESYGITGVSHFLEHLAFKGTNSVGTKDYPKEVKLLGDVDRVYDELIRAQYAAKPDTARIKELQAHFNKLNKDAQAFVATNEYMDMMMKEGGVGTNAYTSNDATQYINSLPSNRLEFWMAMESDRFLHPVFREFFKERDVIMEERRLGLETQPTGKLVEDFMATAFKAHPYQHSVVGSMSDLRRINRKDVEDYFRKYYGPSNLTVAIVGDVKAEEVFTMADRYFGRIPGGPKPEPLRTVEPEQWGERHVTVEAMAQPVLLIGYHRPDIRSKEDLAFDAMGNILGRGRSSRFYESLVKQKKIAVNVFAASGWPATKYPNLFFVYVIPAKDHTAAECLAAVETELERIKKEPVTDQELTKYKRFIRKYQIDAMKSNSRLAAVLTMNDVVRGDWRRAFDIIKDVEAVTAADIQAVAQKYLVTKNRTVGEIKPEMTGEAKSQMKPL